jgi:PEP-CTERM motif
MNTLSPKRFGVAVAVFLLTSAAQAVPTTVVGPNFDIIYDTALTGLFGAPTLSGNNVFFSPTNFKASSTGTQGIVITSSTIFFDIVPHTGVTVTGSSLTEQGDYFLIGSGSTVSVSGQIRAFANSAPLTQLTAPIAATAPLTTVIGPTTTNWTATSALSFGTLAQLDSKGFYRVTIENILLANNLSNPANAAFIEKKFANDGITVAVSNVPEPGQWAMWLAGLGAMGLLVGRRQTK